MNAPQHSGDGQANKSIKIVSFNVAGMKNVLEYKPWNTNKTFEYMFQYLQADIVCLQETKVQMRDLTRKMALVPGFKSFFTFPKVKKGYSGVAIYVSDKLPVLRAEEGITGWLSSDLNNSSGKPYRLCKDPIGGYPQSIDEKVGKELDSEGRAVVLDLGDFVLIGLYCPANSQGDREDYKIAFMDALDQRVRNLIENEKREVVVLGDLNVSRELIDSAEAKQEWFKIGRIKAEKDPEKFLQVNKPELESWKTSSFTRRIVNGWLGDMEGYSRILTDTGRMHHPSRMAMYTCWNMKINARPGNFGSRLDYILISNGLYSQSADILPDLQGSDHCPVEAVISYDSKYWKSQYLKLPRLCTENMDQFRIFNIKSMFKAASASASASASGGASAKADSSEIASARLKVDSGAISSANAQTSSNSSNRASPVREESVESQSRKRKLAGTVSEMKRGKSAGTGQQTLGSFFSRVSDPFGLNGPNASKDSNIPDAARGSNVLGVTRGSNVLDASKGLNNSDDPIPANSSNEESQSEDNPTPPRKNAEDAGKNEQIVRASTDWQSIFAPVKPPLCTGHSEPCVKRLTKKHGLNKGRSFWGCSRPSGSNDSDGATSKFRCNYFKWA